MAHGIKIPVLMIIMFAVTFWAAIPDAWGNTPADPALAASAKEAVNYSVKSLNLQTEISDIQPHTPTQNDNQALYKPKKYKKPKSFWSPSPVLAELIAQIFIYISLIVIAVVIGLAVRDHLKNDSKSRRVELQEGQAVDSQQEVQARMGTAQGEADELARLGRFAEAMHILLLQSVTELRRRLDISIAASLTSREILARINLTVEVRNTFAYIIGWVEISHFGHYKPDAEEYLACRRNFEVLSSALGRGGEQ